MITTHEIYGRVVVIDEELNNSNPFVEVQLINKKDILKTDIITVGKVALSNKGGYIPKKRPMSLIQAYLPLAYSAASQHYQEGSEWEEMLQVATLGLCEAAERVDGARNTSFAAFAKPYISGYLLNHLNPARNGLMNTVSLSAGYVEELHAGNNVGVEEDNLKTVLYGAIEELTPKQKFAVEMVHIQGHTQAHVANMLQITQPKVFELLKRATISLKKQLFDAFK